VVSSQSNITWWARAGAPAWVCSPAPSCSVKVTRVVGAAVVFGEIDSSLVVGSDLAQRAAVDVPFGRGDLARQG
jgi:hypothetical protein